MAYDLDILLGPVIPPTDLALPKAKGVASYAQSTDANFVHLVECRRRSDGKEAVVIDLRIELAQQPVHAIAPVERVAVTFDTKDDIYPDAVSLRADFPNIIHLNARQAGQPKSFCLYLEPYEELQLHWTAHVFVERIRGWLAKSADGTLHPEDQALEPLVFLPYGTLVVPGELLMASQAPLLLYTVFPVDGSDKRSVWIIRRAEPTENGKRNFVAACFACPPQTHGLITSAPSDLAELQRFLLPTGYDIVSEARKVIASWKSGNLFQQVQAAKLFLILELPKRRTDNGGVETTERLAFLCDCTLKELDERLTTFEATHGYSGLIAIPESISERANISLLAFDVTEEFFPKAAAKYNSIPEEGRPFCLLGAGALGSQVLQTLARSGFGSWTIVDNDRLLPHNLARHSLTGSFVGQRKADAMAYLINDLFSGDIAASMSMNVLQPGDERQALDAATGGSSAICDCSASVPVARALAAGEIKTRRAISLFLNPSADALVLLAEDERRACRLDWLEMQYYRYVASSHELSRHLRPASVTRYSNSCREVTTRLSQEAVALFAAIGSRAFREAVGSASAQISIWQLDDAMQVRRFDIVAEPVIVGEVAGWTLCTDGKLLHALGTLRLLRLPNETGGVLLGSYDMQRRILYIVDMLPSPPDSEEWPTSYKRGCLGLCTAIAEVSDRTLMNLEYVGEWHSHPVGGGTGMSQKDRTAMAEISGEMAKVGLPGLMLIVGDYGSYTPHLAEPQFPPRSKLKTSGKNRAQVRRRIIE
jgi:E2/UBC family protein A/ThiF family protein/JAB domain-containing protein similar to deubiquitination enzymes